MKSQVTWDKYVKFATSFILASFILVVSLYYIKEYKQLWYIALIIMFFLMLVVFALITPQYLIIDKKQIVLEKMFSKLKIDFCDITLVENNQHPNIRMFGSGGAFGYLGYFYNKKFGRYISYVGNYSQMFFVKTKQGKKYAFSCENRDKFVSALRDKITVI